MKFLCKLLPKDTTRRKKRLLCLLQTLVPVKTSGDKFVQRQNNAIAIAFNHPTLGEIFRLLIFVFQNYEGRKFLFPVNLPWYEAIAPVGETLKEMGIYITPIITPSTFLKMPKSSSLRGLQTKFVQSYMKQCIAFTGSGDVIIIAPSATRQPTIFSSSAEYEGLEPMHVHTMSFLGLSLYRKKLLDQVDFLPILVIPKGHTRGCNLFRNYEFYVCEYYRIVSKERKAETLKKCKKLDYDILSQIATMADVVGCKNIKYP